MALSDKLLAVQERSDDQKERLDRHRIVLRELNERLGNAEHELLADHDGDGVPDIRQGTSLTIKDMQ